MEESVLDFSSDSFDPLASIYSGEDVKLPDPNAPILDNVETFVARLNKPSTSSGKKSEKKSNKPLNPLGVERQFTQDQMPIQCAKKRPNNVLTWMEKQKQGPMSVLQKCVENQTRVKVLTRKLNGVRGTCTGVLIAFDKHWNLAMADVDETYSRPRNRKPEYDNGKKIPVKNQDKDIDDTFLPVERAGESVIRVLKTRRNTQQCQRHVPQLVLRGEQVILIQPYS